MNKTYFEIRSFTLNSYLRKKKIEVGQGRWGKETGLYSIKILCSLFEVIFEEKIYHDSYFIDRYFRCLYSAHQSIPF